MMKIKNMVLVAFFTALIIIMTFVPNIGYIPTPWLKITLVHIPVILASIIYGWKIGAFMGFVFGMSSLISNTISPNILSFVFTPFYSLGEVGGGYQSLVICFVPRILTGIVPALVYNGFKRNKKMGAAIAGVVGSLVNTLLVIGLIGVFYSEGFALAKNISADAVVIALGTIVLINGIPEAIASGLLAMGIAPIFKKLIKSKKIQR